MEIDMFLAKLKPVLAQDEGKSCSQIGLRSRGKNLKKPPKCGYHAEEETKRN